MGSFQDITSIDDFVFPAYVAQPTVVPVAAVVVLQEIFGVNAHIMAIADNFAKLGYLAVAPSTFQRVKADVNLGYTPADIDTGKALKAAAEAIAPQVMLDVQAAIDFADTLMDEERSAQVSRTPVSHWTPSTLLPLRSPRWMCKSTPPTTVLTATSGVPTTPRRPHWRWSGH